MIVKHCYSGELKCIRVRVEDEADVHHKNDMADLAKNTKTTTPGTSARAVKWEELSCLVINKGSADDM